MNDTPEHFAQGPSSLNVKSPVSKARSSRLSQPLQPMTVMTFSSHRKGLLGDGFPTKK
jgi:hypothetical protein